MVHTPNYCAVCAKPFPGNKYDLRIHLLIHLPGRFRCNLCARVFTNPYTLKKHKALLHSNEKQFACQHCPNRFKTSQSLRRHISVHGYNKQSHECPVCGKRVSQLEPHLRIHSREFRFGCAQCPSKFTDKSALRKHVQYHVGQRPFACPDCSACFSTRHGLGWHCYISHAGSANRGMRQRNKAVKAAGRFSCTNCSGTFHSENALSHHRTIHDAGRATRYSCCVCRARIDDKRDLFRHIIRDHCGGVFVCPECDTVLLSGNALARHIKIVHRHCRTHQCDYCSANFATAGILAIHRRIHTGEKPYACDACPARYAQLSNLRTHMRSCKRAEPHRCDACDVCFSKLKKLSTHRLVHASDGEVVRFGCAVCERYHSCREELKNHLSKHSDFAFACDICPWRFRRERALTLHYAKNAHVCQAPAGQHSDSVPDHASHNVAARPPATIFQCAVCLITWTSPALFTAHFQQHQAKPTATSFPCDLCGSVFENSKTLTRHRRYRHAEPLKCSSCPKQFATPRQLRNHVQALHVADGRKFPCASCQRAYTTAEGLRQHQRNIHDKHRAFKCPQCEAQFTAWRQQKHHVAQHAAGVKLACAVCCWLYERPGSLRAHLLSVHYAVTQQHMPRYRCAVCKIAHFRHRVPLAQHLAGHFEREPQLRNIISSNIIRSAFDGS